MFYRNVLKDIIPFIQTHDILLFYGARQVGKSSLMKLIQEEYLQCRFLSFDLEEPWELLSLNQGPTVFVNNLISLYDRHTDEDLVIFIDEIQYLDNPTSFLKYLYDHYEHLKLIVSWSSTLEIRGKLKDSLAGRMLKFEIYPLSFEEFLRFKEKNELANAIGKQDIPQYIEVQIKEYFKEYLRFWWYPKMALTNGEIYKKAYLKQIVDNYISKDIKDIGKIRDIDGFNRLLHVLASQIWNLLNISELSNKIGVNLETIRNWIALLENTFVVKRIYPYSWNIRWELIKTPKIFFIDTGIRNYILDDYEISGSVFENGFFSYIQNAYYTEHINFFRTKDKQEIDFILDGIPYELKLTYTGKWLLALSKFETISWKKGKVITLEKSERSWKESFYPWEV